MASVGPPFAQIEISEEYGVRFIKLRMLDDKSFAERLNRVGLTDLRVMADFMAQAIDEKLSLAEAETPYLPNFHGAISPYWEFGSPESAWIAEQGTLPAIARPPMLPAPMVVGWVDRGDSIREVELR